MKNIIRKTVSLMLAAALLCTPVFVLAGSDGSPDGYDSWDDFYASLTGESTEKASDYVPEISEMRRLAGKNGTELYFYEKENIIYLSSGGKLWSSIIRPDCIPTDGMDTADWRNLFTVKVSDKSNSVKTYELSSGLLGGFEVTYDYGDASVTMHMSITEAAVSFDAVIGLDDDGLYCTVPDGSIKEEGENKLVSIAVLPCFAAAPVTDDGYIVYCDGSGALIEYSGRKAPNRNVYTHRVWGEEKADPDTIETNETEDIHSLLLPIAGVKHTSGASLAAVTSGEETAVLNIVHGNYYNAYFSFEYRTFYNAEYNFTGSVFDKKEISKQSSRRSKGTDCTVRWFIFDGNKNTYSDMAAGYREYLIKQGVIKSSLKNSVIPVSLDIFIGIKKSGLMGESIQTLTDYSSAAKLLEELKKDGVAGADVRLMGWSRGGYTAVPTVEKTESKAGNSSKFDKYCKENGISVYRDTEWIKGAAGSSGYNGQKDVLRDCIHQIATDKEDTVRLLSPRRFFLSAVNEKIKKNSLDICLSSLGTLLLSGYDADGEINRTEALNAYKSGLKKLSESTSVAVVGGNSYVLPYTDRLYEIPDTDSGYYENTRSVPFYQMVVHGSVNYSSLAGNRSFDLSYQKLKWIETGSLPHYFVTEQPSVKFRDTDYDTVFSSCFSDYRAIITEVYSEFNEKLGGFWYEPMTQHKYITENVVGVTYGNTHTVLINYGDTEAEADGAKVPAKDYIVTEVKDK